MLRSLTLLKKIDNHAITCFEIASKGFEIETLDVDMLDVEIVGYQH